MNKGLYEFNSILSSGSFSFIMSPSSADDIPLLHCLISDLYKDLYTLGGRWVDGCQLLSL